ncbi:Dipeptidyl-peptidase III [Giardia duodenalis assemblage B]|uniref:Dipeptidyl peptidase 3 n=1 Tax=Giardia duodenalis assemblage B TaxID=1394984 RepID=A0A132NSS1_GIAIN|nr:Dipeptidyl-peptidase III [Giardia intestinalis assemblage B]
MPRCEKAPVSRVEKDSQPIICSLYRKLFNFLMSNECPSDALVVNLEPSKSFSKLTERQKQYAAFLSLAAFAGAPVLFDQCSRHTRCIHAFLAEYLKVYIEAPDRQAVLQTVETAVGVDNRETLQYLHDYAGHFYFNCSEYLGLGDTKIIPRCTKESLEAVIKLLGEATHKGTRLVDAFHAAKDGMYDTAPEQLSLGFQPAGCTAYYQPGDFSESEAKQINDLMTAKKMMHENSHVIRHDTWYEISLASVEVAGRGEPIGVCNGKDVCVTRGRGSAELAKACNWLRKAREFADSDSQRKMLDALVEHYRTGDCDLHKRYSEHWVQDKDVVVETYQGFIETYRDPSGVRAEYEAFVACVDPDVSKALHNLVERAPEILPLLPYPRALERDEFIPPVYNAINILCFLNTFSPIGINIPNYDDTRKDIGFKNVTLYNVLMKAGPARILIDFVPEEYKEIYTRNLSEAMFLNVALHELFGHGTTKLLQESDLQNGVLNPLDESGGRLTTCYKDGETYSSVFGAMSNAFEECKAETTSMCLCTEERILRIFNIEPTRFSTMKIALMYEMICHALTNLPLYNPASNTWLQAHAQGRFCIMQACLKWAPNSIKLVETYDPSGKLASLLVHIAEVEVDNIVNACKRLLLHIATYKASADAESAQKFFAEMTCVSDEWLRRREYVCSIKRPSALYCDSMIKTIMQQDGTLAYTLVDTCASNDPEPLDVAIGLCNNILVSSS